MGARIFKYYFSKINRTWPGWPVDAAFISLLITIFCLRFYLFHFLFQGDVFLNIYLHGNPALFRGGWDPYLWGYLGWYPVFGGMFPLNFIIHFFIENVFKCSFPAVIHLIQINVVLSLFLLAFFSYLFFRFSGRSRPASCSGALIISLTGFHCHTAISEFDLFYSHSFMFVPLVLICLVMANRRKNMRWVALAGIFIGVSILGGGNVPMFLFIPAFFLACLFDTPLRNAFSGKTLLRSCLYAFVAIIAGIAIGSAMFIPCIKYMGLSCRSFSYGEFNTYSASPFYTFCTALYRDWWPRYKTRLAFPQFHELDSFLGLPVIFLALAGLTRPGKQTAGKWLMAVMALIALCCMHFWYMPKIFSRPAAWLLSNMSIRYPYRFFMVLLFSVAFFAARGIDMLRDCRASRRMNLFLTIFALASVFYVLFGIFLWRKYTMFRLQPAFGSVLVITLIFSCFIILYVYFFKGNAVFDRRIFPITITVLIFLFYFSSQVNTIVPFDYSLRTEKPDILDNYPSIKQVKSILLDLPERNYSTVPLNTPYRIYSPGVGRMNSWAIKARAYIAFEDPVDDPSMGKFINKYYHCAGEYDSPLFDLYNVRFIRIITGYGGKKLLPTPLFQVYYNPYAFERFFITHKARYFHTDEQLWAALKKASREELKENVFLTYPEEGVYQAVGSSGNPSETIHIGRMQPTQIEADVNLETAGFFCASEQWFPAWEGRVDGVKQKLLRAYGAFWAVSVPKGAHHCEFKFIDRYTIAGKILSVICLVLALIFVFSKKPL